MLGNKYSFEKLEVLQNTSLFVRVIYTHTSDFAEKERYGLCFQMQGASVSVVSKLSKKSDASCKVIKK